jgi:hypothetical protein
MYYYNSRAGQQVGEAGQLPGAIPKLRLTNRKYGASKLILLHEKEFLRKLSAIWSSASPVLGRKKKFKEYRFEGVAKLLTFRIRASYI